jgi:hypothetical protein
MRFKNLRIKLKQSLLKKKLSIKRVFKVLRMPDQQLSMPSTMPELHSRKPDSTEISLGKKRSITSDTSMMKLRLLKRKVDGKCMTSRLEKNKRRLKMKTCMPFKVLESNTTKTKPPH